METRDLTHKLDKLIEALESGEKDETFSAFLRTMGRFRSYSWGNCALIWSQRPEATLVAGFHGWKKQGRSVRRGEKGIAILVPMTVKIKEVADTGEEWETGEMRVVFKTGYVFDLTQTEGKDLEATNFKRDLGDLSSEKAALEAMLAERGVVVEYDTLMVGDNGFANTGHVTVSANNPIGVQTQTLAHELAHHLLHFGDERPGRVKRETEAEAVTCVVLAALGHDVTVNAANYIAAHGGKGGDLRDSFGRVLLAARIVIEGLEPKETARAA